MDQQLQPLSAFSSVSSLPLSTISKKFNEFYSFEGEGCHVLVFLIVVVLRGKLLEFGIIILSFYYMPAQLPLKVVSLFQLIFVS